MASSFVTIRMVETSRLACRPVGVKPPERPVPVLARERALPERVPDEEGAERLQILRSLDGLSHGLDEMRERMEVAADEADDEVVVVDVEAVAGEANVVGQIGVAVVAAEHAVLADDRPLLLGCQPAERSGSP